MRHARQPMRFDLMQGWETFTDTAIKAISRHRTGVVFLLWGASAQSKVGADIGSAPWQVERA